MRSFILILTLVFLLPLSATADTYFKANGVSIEYNGTTATQTRVLTNQETDQTAGHGMLNYWNSDASSSNKNQWHYILAGDFGNSYSEGTHGYIGISMECGVEYHLEGAAMAAGQSLELAYRTSDNQGAKSFTPVTPNPPFVVDDTVVGDYNLDIIASYTMTSTEVSLFPTWADMNASISRGFDLSCRWVHTKDADNGCRVAIDHIFVKVLQKLLVYGIPLNSGKTVTENRQNLELLQLTFNGYDNTSIDINAIRVDLEGTDLNAADITAVKLYKDVDNSGTINTGDTLTGQTNSPASLTNISISGSPLIDDVRRNSKYIIAVDITDTACTPPNTTLKYVGAHIVDHTYITLAGTVDQVASQADRTATNVIDAVNPATLFPIRTGTADTGLVKILRKPSLTATLVSPVAPTSISMGQNFTVQIDVTNASGNFGTAENVLLETPLDFTVSSGSPAAGTSDTPLPFTLVPGGTASWSLTYTGTAAGIIDYRGRAGHNDPGNGQTGLFTSYTSSCGSVEIIFQTVPILQITSMSLTPATASDDQQLTLTTKVKNVGNGPATGVILQNPSTSADWSFQSFPTPNAGYAINYAQDSVTGTADTLEAGVEKTYTYTFSPGAGTTSSGTIYYKITAKDGSGSTSATGNSNQVTIQRRANLSSTPPVMTTSATDPITNSNTVGVDSTFNIILQVNNTGEAAASLVVPSTPSVSLGSVVYGSGPTVNGSNIGSGVTIAGGGNANFVWIYNSGSTPQGPTIVIGNGYAAGKDINSNNAINTGAAVSITNFEVDQLVHPRFTNVTTGDMDLLIAYSSTSSYYAINNSNRIYKFNNIATNLIDMLIPNNDQVSGNTIWLSEINGIEILFFGTTNGRLYALDGTNNAGYWTPGFADSYTSFDDTPVHGMVEFNNKIYVTSGTRLYKLDGATGAKDPNWPATGWQAGSTVQLDCIPAVDNTYIYVGAANGRIYSVREADGVIGGSTPSTDAGKQYTAPFILDGVLYCSNNGGRIVKIPNPVSGLTSYSNYYSVGKNFCDVWIDFTDASSPIWLTDQGGGMLYKIDPATMLDFPHPSTAWPLNPGTYNSNAITWASPPLVVFSKVYMGSYDSVGLRGKAWILEATDGAKYSNWPFVSTTDYSPIYSPVTLDFGNSVFLLGSQDNNIYIFSTP